MTQTFGQAMGVTPVSKDNNTSVCTLTIEERHLNAGGTLHGGMTATLLDSTCGSVATINNNKRATISLTTNYVSAGLLGDQLTCTAHINRRTGKLAFINATIINQNGTTIATATAIFRITNK